MVLISTNDNGFPVSGTAFTEGLNGIASCREGHVVVTRTVASPTTGGGEQINVTDPDSGFTFVSVAGTDWTKGKSNISASWITGFAVGNLTLLNVSHLLRNSGLRYT
jgi:hypothetical protein